MQARHDRHLALTCRLSAHHRDFLCSPQPCFTSSSRFTSSSSRASPVLVLPEASRPTFGGVGIDGLSSLLGAKGKAAREQFVWAAAGSLFSSFIAQPFEAGKILAQVHHRPRRPPTVRSNSRPGPPTGEDEDEQEDGEGEGAGERDLDDEDEVRTFFEDAGERSRARSRRRSTTVDADGYVLRTGADGVERERILRRGRGEGNGPGGLTKRMWNGEAPSAPWKGATLSLRPMVG